MGKRKLKLGVVIGLVMTLVLIVVAGCGGPTGPVGPAGPTSMIKPVFEKPTAPDPTGGVVEATWTIAGPVIDSVIDPVWDKATELKIIVGGSVHENETTGAEVTVKFLYTNEYIYTLVQYPDATRSMIGMPMWLWDGTGWYELESVLESLPEPWYEDDMMGIMWNINTPEFEERGCATKCHVIWKGEEDVQIPFDILPEENILHLEGACDSCHEEGEVVFLQRGGYIETEGQYIDMWMERTNRIMPLGFADDWHWTVPRAGYPFGGRFSDDGTAIYYNNQSRITGLPLYMETNPADYFDAMRLFKSEIALGDAVAVDGLTDEQISEYWANYQAIRVPIPSEHPNALVPQRILDDFAVGLASGAQALGNRWDVRSAGEWADGIWTLEFGRKLVTGHKEDVQFDDFTKIYSFDLAISNAGGEYESYHVGTPLHLVFAPPGEEAAPSEEEVTSSEEGALPPIRFTIEEGELELSGDDLAPYGEGLNISQKPPWTITVEKGSTITINVGTGFYARMDHTITIEGTDLDVYLMKQTKKGPFEVTFNEAGWFKVYCKLHPADEHGGETLIAVTEGGVLPPRPEAPSPEAGALPPIEFKLANDYIQFVGDDLAPYGEGLVSPLNSEDGPWTVTVKKGSTITVTKVSMSGNPATLDHNLIIEGTDFDVYLQHGETAGPLDVTFDEVGTFKVYCKLHPDDHGGEALIVVTEGGVAPPPETGALPPIEFKLANDYIQFVGDDLTPYGSGLSSPLNSEDGPWTVTVKKGSTITVTQVSMSGNPATLDHNLIIEGTTFDVYLSHGETAGPLDVTFDEVGTFKVYCKLHPDDHGGEALIVVEE